MTLALHGPHTQLGPPWDQSRARLDQSCARLGPITCPFGPITCLFGPITCPSGPIRTCRFSEAKLMILHGGQTSASLRQVKSESASGATAIPIRCTAFRRWSAKRVQHVCCAYSLSPKTVQLEPQNLPFRAQPSFQHCLSQGRKEVGMNLAWVPGGRQPAVILGSLHAVDSNALCASTGHVLTPSNNQFSQTGIFATTF